MAYGLFNPFQLKYTDSNPQKDGKAICHCFTFLSFLGKAITKPKQLPKKLSPQLVHLRFAASGVQVPEELSPFRQDRLRGTGQEWPGMGRRMRVKSNLLAVFQVIFDS
jgi:hypothetical protein